MITFLYIAWFSLPTIFFTLALWAKLEQASGSIKKHNPNDLFKSGIFTLICVVVSILLDKYIVQPFLPDFLPEFLPLGVVQFLLLPLVMMIAAQVIGPSNDILIGEKNYKNKLL